jgi:putative membrane protein
MKGIVLGIVVTAIAFVILTVLLPQVKYDGDYVHLAIIAVLFGIANGLIKPVVKLLSFPINLMTMGLFGIVINVALFMGVAWVSTSFIKFQFTIAGWPTHGLTFDVVGTAVIASIALGIISAVLGLVIKD